MNAVPAGIANLWWVIACIGVATSIVKLVRARLRAMRTGALVRHRRLARRSRRNPLFQFMAPRLGEQPRRVITPRSLHDSGRTRDVLHPGRRQVGAAPVSVASRVARRDATGDRRAVPRITPERRRAASS